MIKSNYHNNKLAASIPRQHSYESTTSSNGSHLFRSINDLEPTTAPSAKSPNKFKPIAESKVRKSTNKINNLRLLGILRVNDQQREKRSEVNQYKKIFKVTQKGLNYDNHQYFLSLNASIMNNHLIRQASPVERLKVNLYDDERTQQATLQQAQTLNQINNSIDTLNSGSFAYNQMQQTTQANYNNNNTQRKRNTFRRRSCYCNQSGKQSQKAQRIDFLFPTSLIKNRIFMRMKKKQEIKQKAFNEKDLIIQNLNRTFDMQEKNSARNSAINSPNLINGLQQNFNFAEKTPKSGRGNSTPFVQQKQNNIQIHSQQRSQFSHITSPKSNNQILINQNSQRGSTSSKSNINGEESQTLTKINIRNSSTPVNGNNKPTFGETIDNIHKDDQLNTPQQNTNHTQNIQTKQHHRESSNHSQNNNSKKNDLILRSSTKRNQSSQKNSPKNNNVATPSPHKQTPNSSNKASTFFNNVSYFGNYLTTGAKNNKEEQSDNIMKFQYEQNYPAMNEKRRKLIAKLRIASKLVGIQEKQRKKSFLYHQDYYNALQDIENNVVEQDHEVEQNCKENLNQEQKYVLVRKAKNDNKKICSPVVHQIIDAHNLRFNTTLNSFLDQRSKSYNTLVPPSATSISTLTATQKQKKSQAVTPFRSDAYLQPIHVLSPSPSKKNLSLTKNNGKQSLLLFQSYQKNSKKNGINNHRKLNETEQTPITRTEQNSVNRVGQNQMSRTASNRFMNMSNITEKTNQKQQNSMISIEQMNNHQVKNQTFLNNSQESLKHIQINNGNNEGRSLDPSKTSLGQLSNGSKQNYKSSQEILSLEQFGKYEQYYTKNPKQSVTMSNFNTQSKAKQKFDLLLSNQTYGKSSYLQKNQTPMKDTYLLSNSKSVNQSQINFRNSSQPDLLQQSKYDQSQQKQDKSQKNSTMGNNFFIPKYQSQALTRPNYLSAKFDGKNRKSIIQSYMA